MQKHKKQAGSTYKDTQNVGQMSDATPDAKNVSPKHKPTGRQLRRVRDAFKKKPRTMLDAARDLNVERSSICRIVHDWLKTGEIFRLDKRPCPISRALAYYHTTDRTIYDRWLESKRTAQAGKGDADNA